MKTSCSLCLVLTALSLYPFAPEASGQTKALDARVKPTHKLTAFQLNDEPVGAWDKRMLVYRLSDHLDLGVVRTGYLGRGVGLKYHLEGHISIWGAFLRSSVMEKRTPMFGISVSF